MMLTCVENASDRIDEHVNEVKMCMLLLFIDEIVRCVN
jgi:hypothetical protein